MRLDRFLTLYIFGPLARLRKPRGLRIPILMYHSISDDPESGHPYYWINTSPALFADHMRYLADHGYEVIPLSTAVAMIRGFSLNTKHQTLNTVVLTFDDGYADFFSAAFPVLQRHGFTATVFLPTDYIDGTKPGLRGKQHLTWDQVRELQEQGITFGSHTCSHPQLSDLPPGDAERELLVSRRVFDGQRVACASTFCYPFRFPEQNTGFVERFNETLQRVEYEACASTRIGTINAADDIFALKRIPVNSGDDLPLFSAKLSGGYDWLSTLQILAKKLVVEERQRPR